jgi:hypothetical protein
MDPDTENRALTLTFITLVATSPAMALALYGWRQRGRRFEVARSSIRSNGVTLAYADVVEVYERWVDGADFAAHFRFVATDGRS